MGAGIAIEKTIKDAKEDIAVRIAELNKTKTALEQQLNQVLIRLQEGQNRLQELAATLKK